MARSFGEKLVHLRWWIVAGWLGAAAALAALTPATDPGANELLTFLPDDAASLRAAGALARHFPQSAGLSQAVVVIERRAAGAGGAARPSGPAGKLTPGDLAAMDRLAERLRQPPPPEAALPPVAVRAPGDFPPAFLRNPLVSADGSAAISIVNIPANFVTIRSARTVGHIRELIAGHRWPEGLSVAVTGSAAFGADYAEAANRSHRGTLRVTVVAVLIILLGVYRAPGAAGAVLATVSLAAVVAHFVLALGARWGLHVGTAEKIFVFVLLYGVGVDYSLLYLSRFRERLDAAAPPATAAAEAWSATAPTIAASGGTDIVGLAMLSAATFKVFRTTGRVLPIALLVGVAAALTLVPAAAAILHRRLFWPGRRSAPRQASPTPRRRRRLWPAIAHAVTRRPGLVFAAAIACLLVPAVWGFGMDYVYDALTGLEPEYGAVRGMEMARRHWPTGQISPVTCLLEAGTDEAGKQLRATAGKLTEALNETPGVADVRSVTQPLGRDSAEAWLLIPAVARRVNAEYLAARATRLVIVPAAPGFSNAAMASLERVRGVCGRIVPAGVRAHLAGATAEMADIRAVTRRDFRRVGALVLAAVFLIVLALIRDAVLSAFMVASTVLSYLATLGITRGFFVGLCGQGGLDWKVRIFLFVVLVAVGVDYNIFLAARLAEESRRRELRAAAREAIVRTGRIISSAGLIMAATLGSLMVGDISLLVQLGFALAVGMLVDTFVVRPLLLPAFAVLTGRTGRALRR